MAEIKIKQVENTGDYSTETVFEANGVDSLNEGLIKSLFGTKIQGAEATPPESVTQLATVAKNASGVDWDVVAIYDNEGIPSIMHRFRKVTNKELFGGSDKPHPAFVIGGEVYDEIYISVYENCEINGKPYSLPYQKPWTSISNDDAARACFSKGAGWHMMTAVEWGLLANLSLKNGTLPHGNTKCGKYHADESEKGQAYDSYRTLTGSGPATWTHDHTPTGVHDLCGNVWEMLRGTRMKNGVLQVAKDNDAALDIDLTMEGDDWQAVTDNAGKAIRVSIDDEGNMAFTTCENAEQSYDGSRWSDVQIDCESEQLKELALFNGEPDAYCYVDSTEGEYFPKRGGNWANGTDAGVFNSSFNDARSNSDTIIGFRSAYFCKTGN